MVHDVKVFPIKSVGCSRAVMLDGVMYSSVAEVRRKYGICETQVYQYIKRGMSYADALALAIYKKEQMLEKARIRFLEWEKEKALMERKSKSKIITYNGISYPNLTRACESLESLYGNELSLNPVSIKSRAKKAGLSVQEFFPKMMTKKLRIRYYKDKEEKRRHGKFHGLYMKQIYRLMSIYLKNSGFDSVDCPGYAEYLAEQIGVKTKHVLWMIDDYNRFLKRKSF